MKSLVRYVLSRIVAGFVLFFPLAIVFFLLAKALAALSGLNAQLAAAIPQEKIGLIPVATLISILSLLIIIFLLGVLWAPRSDPAGTWLERKFLNRIPGYSLIRGAIFGAVGVEAEKGPRVGILRRAPGVEELVLILDELADGRSLLFLPNAPSPSSGKLLVAQSALVEPTQVKVMTALKVFTDWGQGIGEVLPPVRD